MDFFFLEKFCKYFQQQIVCETEFKNNVIYSEFKIVVYS